MVSVLFVCTGNICRSPSAEGVFLSLLKAEGLEGKIHVDSAGTHGYHVDHPPDSRATGTAKKRGYDLSPLRARKVSSQDFETFDYILAMDRSHDSHLKALCPMEYRHKIKLFLSFVEDTADTDVDVPDPYYGHDDGFEHMMDLIESGCRGFLKYLQQSDVLCASS